MDTISALFNGLADFGLNGILFCCKMLMASLVVLVPLGLFFMVYGASVQAKENVEAEAKQANPAPTPSSPPPKPDASFGVTCPACVSCGGPSNGTISGHHFCADCCRNGKMTLWLNSKGDR